MNPATRQLIEFAESLGDNRESDLFLAGIRGERASLLRWSAGPLSASIALVRLALDEDADSATGFCLDDLEPSAPGMVLDRTLGLRFHSAMRSVERQGRREFEADKTERKALHAREKVRFDEERAAFAMRLADERPRLYLVKTNTRYTSDELDELDALLARRPKGSHLLVSVTQAAEASMHRPRWQSDTHVRMSVSGLAPYDRNDEFDPDAWRHLFECLAADPRVMAVMAGVSVDASTGWDATASPDIKEEQLHERVSTLASVEQLTSFVDGLTRMDPVYRRHVGGDILDALTNDPNDTSVDLNEDFDNRYVRLLGLHSQVDLARARELHESAEDLYRYFGKSFVRYSRIGSSIENARGCIEYFKSIDQRVVPIVPMADRSLVGTTLPEGASAETVTTIGAPASVCLALKLASPRERRFERLSSVDDTDGAEGAWIEPRRESAIDEIEFHVLNETCVTWRPSCITFRENGIYRYAASMRDMYHHACVAGKVGLGKGKERVPSAYFLPRYGPPENHYHTLVDKLPTLYGYRLLGLDCPLVAAYEPNETMKYMMELMDIDPAMVRVDMWSDIVAERGIVPTPPRLRPLFIDFCALLPRGRSPVGPRVYISRGGASGRGMTNESDVEDVLRARGFDIVAMEDHEFEAQMAIAANAEIIVAPHGAGMTNMIFASRGCRIIELIPERYMVRFFWQLAVDCLHRYSVLTGSMVEAEAGDGPIGQALRWHTDTDDLQRLLDDVGYPIVDSARTLRRSA